MRIDFVRRSEWRAPTCDFFRGGKQGGRELFIKESLFSFMMPEIKFQGFWQYNNRVLNDLASYCIGFEKNEKDTH